MGIRAILARDPESMKWRRLRAEYDRLEALDFPAPRLLVGAGNRWRAIPSERRTARETAAMETIPSDSRTLIDAVIDGYAPYSTLPTFVALSPVPVVGFVDVSGLVVGSSAWITLSIDPVLLAAPAGFAKTLAARAAVTAPNYLRREYAGDVSTWPSRSAMVRLRKLWATCGDYPAPDGWNYAASTLLPNAYWQAGIDHAALTLSGERIAKEMAEWADAQPHPHDPRYYPSWRGRFLAQERDAEIFS